MPEIPFSAAMLCDLRDHQSVREKRIFYGVVLRLAGQHRGDMLILVIDALVLSELHRSCLYIAVPPHADVIVQLAN